jgi:hypothetical protein
MRFHIGDDDHSRDALPGWVGHDAESVNVAAFAGKNSGHSHQSARFVFEPDLDGLLHGMGSSVKAWGNRSFCNHCARPVFRDRRILAGSAPIRTAVRVRGILRGEQHFAGN